MVPIALGLTLLQLFATPSEHRANIAGWTLEWRRDAFRERQACRLHRGAVDYTRQALVFRLPRSVDTSSAVYRIDDGQPLLSRDDAADIARLGFALHDDDLANPSGGAVRIVASKLKSARTVVVEAKPYGSKARFTVEGLSAALTAAHSHCAEEDFTRAWEG